MAAPGKGEAWYAYQKALDEEVEVARGSRSNLNNRLSEHLNPDGTPKAGSSIAKDWKASGDTPTYVSTTSFTVPGDKEAIYVKGLRLQLDLNASTVYNTVDSSSHAAGTTTITVETANLTADLQGVDYGIVSPGASGSLAGHRHSGEGDGGLYDYAADAEASDTYKVSLSPAPSAYYAGMLVHFKANTANTGAATLNVNNLGDKTIKKYHDQGLDTGDIESGQIVTVIYDGTNFQMLSQLEGGGLPKNHISGLTLTHGADTDHDITVAAGLEARDATNAIDMTLAAETTKQFDVEWAVGNNAGGFAAGESLPASGTIHIWEIKRSDTGVVDIFGNDHATSGLTPSLPANYDYKRRIGSYRTDASNNIINGDWWGTGCLRMFMLDTPILDISVANPGTNAVTATLSVPGGIVVKAIININSAMEVYLSALNNVDMAPSITVAPLRSISGATLIGAFGGGPVYIISNTSSQIRYRGKDDYAIYIATIGWVDSL